MIVQIDFSAPLTLEEIIAFGKTPEEGNNHFETFIITRSYAALRAADLDWIVGPGFSLGGYILEKTMKTNLKP